MRPERLELEGFMAYRDPTVLDLRDVDLFAITGPTGAGKSSLVDAICFALYGNVPRLGKRATEPVISQGRTGARLRLDFSIDDTQYTLVRVVRRGAKGGAQNKEVRLERTEDGEVLAGSARELDDAVETLLGLSYEHFTTCVVLPQGQFARFLHEEPAKRRQLLTELLELGYLEQLRKLADNRKSLAHLDRTQRAAELEGLVAYANEEQLAKVGAEIAALEALRDAMDTAGPALEEHRVAVEVAARAADEAAAAGALLDALEPPAGLDRIGEVAHQARVQVEHARTAEDEVTALLAEAEAELEALGDRAAVTRQLERHAEAEALRGRLRTGDTVLAATRDAATTGHARLETAERSRARAQEVYDGACRADRAGEFVAALALGEPCPVCGQEVRSLPDHHAADVALAQGSLAEADKVLADARNDAEVAERELQRAEAKHEELRRQLQAVDTDLDGAPPVETLRATEAAISASTQRVTELKANQRRLATARKQAESSAAAAEDQEVQARRAFGEARDRVAALGPPAAGHQDLVADWRALLDWAEGERPARRSAELAARARAEAADAARRELIGALRQHAADAGLRLDDAADPTALRDACVGALQSACDDRDAITASLARIDEARRELDGAAERETIAAELANHLRSNRFVHWVLDDVLRRLATGATAVLHDLSGGAYSLTIGDEDDSFEVIDHANADARRSVRTLSGGETFLASLALALAMADQVRDLASDGAARLDALFLDEGFGTLDPDTLDTVAATLEALKDRGRMVGVITHVDELAARLPARFEVRKGPTTATVARV